MKEPHSSKAPLAMRKIFEAKIKNNPDATAISVAKQLEAVAESQDDMVTAFYDNIWTAKTLRESCTFALAPIKARRTTSGMAFQKDWPYTKLFNYHLLALGRVENSEGPKNGMLNIDTTSCKGKANQLGAIRMTQVWFCFELISIGCGLSIITVLIEIALRKKIFK